MHVLFVVGRLAHVRHFDRAIRLLADRGHTVTLGSQDDDLELRGPGEVLGTRQTGVMQLRIADLLRDADLLPQVIEISDQLLATAPEAADALIRRWIRGEAEYAKV